MQPLCYPDRQRSPSQVQQTIAPDGISIPEGPSSVWFWPNATAYRSHALWFLNCSSKHGTVMALAAITNRGLKTIAFLVAVLWGCLAVEHLTVRASNLRAAQALEDMRRLRLERRIESDERSTSSRPALRRRSVKSTERVFAESRI